MNHHITANSIAFLLKMVLVLLLVGCLGVSETIKDEKAGINGGFEVSMNGLPVNWTMYTPNTVPNADFDIVLDRETVKEGDQSLRFDVRKCAERGGGFFSPGFTNQFNQLFQKAEAGKYRVSFWIKNNGAKALIKIDAVPGKGGDSQRVEINNQLEEWQFFEKIVNVRENQELKMELGILQPGTFWIDDVNVEKLK